MNKIRPNRKYDRFIYRPIHKSHVLPLRAFAFLAITGSLTMPTSEASGNAIFDLRAQGFMVEHQSREIVYESGIAPYQNLQRRMLVTNYILSKGAERYHCQSTYDSQQETLEAQCEKL